MAAEKKRRWLKLTWRRVIAGAGILGIALGVWGLAIEPGFWRVDRSRLQLPGLDARVDGMTVAVLTDLHVGAPHIDLAELDEIVDATNAAKPDLVVILGDLVIHGVRGGTFVAPEPIAERLGRLRAPLGVLAVLGNHDWWYDGVRVTRALTNAGIAVLEDESVLLPHEAPVWVAGVGDLSTRAHDIERALHSVPAGVTCIVITHHPDVFVDMPARATLTLAGHTHGGQVRLPVVGPPVVPSAYGARFAQGHIVEDGRHMFVSVGIGTSILPIRIGVAPRVDLLTLVREPA